MYFDPKQAKEIKKTMKVLVKDMRSLYQIYPYKDIHVGITMDVGGDEGQSYGTYWRLIISGKSINLYSNKYDNYTALERQGTQRAIYTDGELEAHYKFIQQYDYVREQIETIVCEHAKESSLSIAKMREYQQKYCHNATIEIETPETINNQCLEVVEKDGQKIGTLRFSGITLKIIASENIEIVNKSRSKQKRK